MFTINLTFCGLTIFILVVGKSITVIVCMLVGVGMDILSKIDYSSGGQVRVGSAGLHHSSCHLHAQVGSHSLVNHVGNAHSRRYLAEVGDDASVETSEPLRPEDVFEQPQGVGLIPRQGQLLPNTCLTLELGSDQGQGVGSQLSATRTGDKTSNRQGRP